MRGVRVERLDYLGIVVGVCQEIGLGAFLDALAGPSQQQVSVGTATVAMILNGLGFSNRRLYLVAQFFASKPVEHLLGAGITAEMLHDDCFNERWIGCTSAILPRCSLGSRSRPAADSGLPRARCMWTRPRLPSVGSMCPTQMIQTRLPRTHTRGDVRLPDSLSPEKGKKN